MSSYMPLGFNPSIRKRLGWRSLVDGDPESAAPEASPLPSVRGILPLSSTSSESPDEIHRQQQAAAAAKAPSTVAAGGAPRLPGWGGAAQDVREMLSGFGDIEIGHRGGARGKLADLFSRMPRMATARADAGGGPEPSAAGAPRGMEAWSPEEQRTYAEFIKGRPGSPGGPPGGGGIAAAASRGAGGGIPRRGEGPPPPSPARGGGLDWSWGKRVDLDPATGRPVGDSTLTAPMTEGAQVRGRESRGGGGLVAPSVEDVAYMPESVIEEAANRRQLEDLRTPGGVIPPSARTALAFQEAQGEIKFAAMDRIVDQDRDQKIAEIQARTDVSPAQKRDGIDAAHEEALRQKLWNRQVGNAGWPRAANSDLDLQTGEPAYGATR